MEAFRKKRTSTQAVQNGIEERRIQWNSTEWPWKFPEVL
jgi:hypothetical protein